MFFDVNLPHAKRRVAVGAEVDRIRRMLEQPHAIKGAGPDKDFHNMQIKHEEDRPSQQERSRDKTGFPQAQPLFAAPLLDLDPVETHSVEQCEKHQHERADADRGERL